MTGLLDELFKTILQFCGTQNQLHTDIATLVSTRRLRRARAAERTAEGRWGLGADDADDDEGRALGQEYDREADDAVRASLAAVARPPREKRGSIGVRRHAAPRPIQATPQDLAPRGRPTLPRGGSL